MHTHLYLHRALTYGYFLGRQMTSSCMCTHTGTHLEAYFWPYRAFSFRWGGTLVPPTSSLLELLSLLPSSFLPRMLLLSRAKRREGMWRLAATCVCICVREVLCVCVCVSVCVCVRKFTAASHTHAYHAMLSRGHSATCAPGIEKRQNWGFTHTHTRTHTQL